MTEEMGKWMAENGHDLVFGGCNSGLMDCIGKAVKANGGRTIGVVPTLVERGGRTFLTSTSRFRVIISATART